MNDLLENELIKQYFGCGCEPLEPEWPRHTGSCYSKRAMAVLRGMQAVINKGERCLLIGQNGEISETRWMSEPMFGIRSNAIRLPVAFQPKAEKCDHSGLKRYCGKDVYCEACKREISAELTDPVEERIKRIREHYVYNGFKPDDRLENELRELVALARGKA